MSVKQISSLILIASVVGCFALASAASNGGAWTASKASCEQATKSLDSVSKFVEFVEEMNQTPDLEGKKTTKIINNCLNSYSAVREVNDLSDIVKQIQAGVSVCEESFARQLYGFGDRIIDLGDRCIDQNKSHALVPFTTKLIGQVILTCKRNLEAKLEQAEQTDENLKQSFDVVENDQVARKLVEQNVSPAEREPDLPENLLSATTLLFRRNHESGSVVIRVEDEEAIEQYVTMKRACRLIESYADNSIFSIMRLAYTGVKAGDEGDVTDNKLKSSPIVKRWLKAVQYCQGAELAIPLPRESIPRELYYSSESKTFDGAADHFEEIGSDLQCKFESKQKAERKEGGVKGWFKKNMDKLNQKLQ